MAGRETGLETALIGLRDTLTGVRLPIDLPGTAEQRLAAADLVRQLDDYVLPRLATIDAPLLAVVGGSTGAGKSTLVNSLVGRRVTAPGVIRPTTRSPVLVHHSSDASWFTSARVLPGLARSSGASNDTRSLQLVADDGIPPGLAILDAPDIDSVVADNRKLAAQLLAAADLWLFVTSAARYADAVPWDFLLAAADRSAAVAVVLDRIPPRAMAEVPPHLGRLMGERGLGRSPLFAVPETDVDADGLLPAAAIQPIRSWLARLAADQASRSAVVHQTLDGAIAAVARRTPGVAQALDEQTVTLDQLRGEVDASYAEAVRTVGVQTADGTLLRGEVLARWQEFVGTGEFFRAMEQKISWLRDRITAVFRAEPAGVGDLKVAVSSGLEALIRSEADAAAERADASWQANAAGRQLLGRSGQDLTRAAPDFADRSARAIRDWQGAVLDLVADTGMAKRSRARFMALGVNGVGAALMIVVFAQTGGITGAEVGIAGGTTVIAQRVLEAVFGDQAVRRLATTAKDELDARVAALMSDELLRYHRLLDEAVGDPELASRLRAAADGVERELAATGSPAASAAATAASERTALSGARPALEPPQVRQVPYEAGELLGADDRDIVDAELVEESDDPPRAALMAIFGRRSRTDETTGLADRVRALADAADGCRGRVPDEVVDEAQRVAHQVDRRLAFSGAATVVALAGATGSGKSSLFNALSGTELARVGVTRPTTSEPLAVTWGEEPTEDLLDWLQVPRRHALPPGTGSGSPGQVLDGLVLLDLPDHDSTEKSNQLQVDRLVQLVDVMVWVVDPQKYADAVLHERYLRPLVEHAPVMVVVLNQIDRLPPAEREACLRDLRRLLDSEGLQKTTIRAVSAETGEGLPELKELIASRVADKLAAARRLAADVSTAADRLAAASGNAEVPELTRRSLETMNTAMAEAAGARVVGDAVRDAWRIRGAAATGWPVIAWIGRLKPDPLRRLHLDRLTTGGKGQPKEIDPTGVGRSSLPTRSGVQQARVDTAVRDLAGEASTGLTRGWTDAVKAAARSQEARLPDALDRAVARTDLDVDRRRRWWQVVRVLQWILLAAVVAGLLWLAASFVLAYLQLPPLPPVTWGRLPAPTVLVLGGVLAGLLLGGLSRIGVVVGAARRERAARAALRRSVTAVTGELVVQPVREELDRYSRAREALTRATAR